MTRLFSYVVRHDTGFAPNPFWGYCTLATCKPDIRRAAKCGDWIVGTGAKGNVGADRVIYAMQVEKVVPLGTYGVSWHFAKKRPKMDGTVRQRVGDAVYFQSADGKLGQRESRHGPADMKRDLRGKYVLVSKTFWYWGRDAIPLPKHLHKIVKRGPGHRSKFDGATIQAVTAWIREQSGGRRGVPSDGSTLACDCRHPEVEH